MFTKAISKATKPNCVQICLESKGCLVFFFQIQFIPFIYIIYIYIQLKYSNLNVSVTQYV